ncbi:hypothetical protein M2352_001811 [Azospirillum fermentarium]|uniref:hypothetical protein n=1 Tax=Azospirillum fermentarium TaxID=1233114 RepID=UPI002227425E|nr:hypothetical protein [Azospirillum fermentarium]MCW2246220.1 hypothetical protein [Azospirillum fermentarium]
MQSTGAVIFISRNQGMVVVQHDDGFAVVELLGDEGELEVGDRVSGDWDALGGETIRASRLQRNMDVYMQGSWGFRDHAIRIARNTGGG